MSFAIVFSISSDAIGNIIKFFLFFYIRVEFFLTRMSVNDFIVFYKFDEFPYNILSVFFLIFIFAVKFCYDFSWSEQRMHDAYECMHVLNISDI